MTEYYGIPAATLETLRAWIEHGRPMGSFCQAVISNDLTLAAMRADEYNRRALADIVQWLVCNAPPCCWGAPEALERWPKVIAAKSRGGT